MPRDVATKHKKNLSAMLLRFNDFLTIIMIAIRSTDAVTAFAVLRIEVQRAIHHFFFVFRNKLKMNLQQCVHAMLLRVCERSFELLKRWVRLIVDG